MTEAALVFVHSPLVGPLTWRSVAEAAGQLDRPVVLIGHSGAGPLLPGIAAAVAAPVRALLYVDAGLPYPGRSWFETAPAQLTGHLRDLAVDGWLPPWYQWFEPEVLAPVVPGAELRKAFTADLAPLPLAYFQEPMSAVTWSGPAGYLLLSEGYRDDAARASAQGMPVVEHLSHHLAMLTSPDEAAVALRDLLTELQPVA